MADPISFIGRTAELQKIKELIEAWDTCRVLCIHGEGGVGKTRLLEEIRRRYGPSPDNPVLVADIIDFDDRSLHVAENIERRIVENLGAEAVEVYARKVHDWHKMRLADVSAEELEEQARQVWHTLVSSFNRVSANHRVVLLLDTMEKLEATNAWDQLTRLMLQAHNALFVLAGRSTKELYNKLRCDLAGLEPDLIELEPLEPDFRQEYLQEKQQRLNVTLDKALAEKLLVLTRGKPILIDLAVEWLSRNIPLDWLTTDLDLEKLSPADLEERQAEFQYQLVAHIGQRRRQMDHLVLLMARVYPLDANMIAQGLGIDTLADAEALLEQAKTYVFVKAYPSGKQIYLHDEVRRMVRDHVWPKIDPYGDWRQSDSQFAVDYLKPQAESLALKIKNLAADEKEAHQAGKAKEEFDTFVERQALAQELWAIREQLLFHTLFTNVAAGVRLFIEIFTQATQEYQYSFRQVLLEQMGRYMELTGKQKFLQPLSDSQQYEVDIRRAKFLLDSAGYEEAEKLLKLLLDRPKLEPEQQVDTRIQLANVVLRLGRFDESIRLFQEAVDISKANDLPNWLVKAENGLGFAYRHTTNRTMAREHYEAALDAAITLDLKHDQALLYSNLGFIYAYIPDQRSQAADYCKASLRLWEELDDKRGIGRAYSTLGCVTFMDGQFNEALGYLQKALNIFEPVDDPEWLSTVYSWRAAVCMSTNDLDQAEKDLLESMQRGVKKDRPLNLSRLGLLYVMQGKLDQAEKTINECRALALELNDVLYQMVSIRDLARLARHRKDYGQLEVLEGYLNDYLQVWQEPQDRRALGMLYLNFGSLALGLGNVDKAIGYYKQGLTPLAELGRYGSDTMETHIQRLEQIFVQELELDPATIRSVGAALLAFWQSQKYHRTYPNVLIDLKKWASWGGI